jgi:hypothetical protein
MPLEARPVRVATSYPFAFNSWLVSSAMSSCSVKFFPPTLRVCAVAEETIAKTIASHARNAMSLDRCT